MKSKENDVTVIVDSREQEPYRNLNGMNIEVGTLSTGDYSIKGLENHVAVERKSLSDLCGCMTSGRDRFTRELQRLKAYPERLVVVEATFSNLQDGTYRSKLNPNSATNTIISWIGEYTVPILFAGDRETGEWVTARFLHHAARRFEKQYERFNSHNV